MIFDCVVWRTGSLALQLERNRWMVGVETLRPSIYSGSFGSGTGKIIYFSPILFRVGEPFIFGQTGTDKKETDWT